MNGNDDTIIDLDQPADSAQTTDCPCGARRTLVRYFELRLCPSRALARLRRAHPDECAKYLADEKRSALGRFEEKWRRHLAGDHES